MSAKDMADLTGHELAQIICPKCGEQADQVLSLHERKRAGWYCAHCKHWERAIGREKRATMKGDEA